MDFGIGKGRWFGFSFSWTDRRHGFVLMVFGRTISYAHFLEDNIGIAWCRMLEIGPRRWWFTKSWKMWAKRDKNGLMYALGG